MKTHIFVSKLDGLSIGLTFNEIIYNDKVAKKIIIFWDDNLSNLIEEHEQFLFDDFKIINVLVKDSTAVLEYK